MFYVVSYDVAADDRRGKVHDILLNYGTRVQYSVFECDLEPAQLSELQGRLAALIKPKEDNVRYYRLCRDCLGQTLVVGTRPLTKDPDYYVV